MATTGQTTTLPATMPAAVYQGNRSVVVERVPIPELKADQVLLEVSHCGICGSDLHLMMEDWGPPGLRAGHEFSGVVVAVGEAVTRWSPGDRAVAGPRPGCGVCERCRSGHSNICAERQVGVVGAGPAGYARYTAVDSAALFALPDSLDLRMAALAEPVAVALRGVRRAGVTERSRVLVTGAGPIGLLTVAVLSSFGVRDITVSEPSPGRRDLAVRCGAAAALEPTELLTPPIATELVAHPFDMAIECSGRSDAMEAALAQLDRGGRLILSGTGMRRPRFDANRIILHELSITGTVEYTKDDFESSIDMLAAGRLPASDLIEPDDVPLDQLQRAMERLVNGELAGKVMVVPRA